ncbi:MAG: RloB family protein [Pseudomonas sp.]|uniref:RloB family protein n=1 Tax=Pseudomonas sp. TaxID=306 RepID=UPI00271A96C0|nr:RloB family protein [Pseudomonas sp.]MDO9617584.1 RloB family protein [Pseudomonas sp.]
MGKDEQPKHRQAARELKRRAAVRQPYERLLIVCEGAQTEPQYLREIQQTFRLATAHVQVLHSQIGTEPQQVLEYALIVFKEGDRDRGVHAGEFDRIVVVFDRDEHKTYHAALAQAAAQSGKIRNDNCAAVPIDVVASVPCFELWLLLHFEDVHAPLHRHEALERLKMHLPSYEKGSGGHWATALDRVELATQRAQRLAKTATAHDGTQPYTAMHELVSRLVHLKD